MSSYALMSLEPGTGRTFVAANLGAFLAQKTQAPVLLVELKDAAESELSLYLGISDAKKSEPFAPLPGLGKIHLSLACLGHEAGPEALNLPASRFGTVLVDGLSL